MKLREMRLRNYLQHKERKTQVRHSWRLRGLSRRAILRREGKSTRMLLQELDKVLDSWHKVSQGKMGKPAAIGKDVSTCFHLAMATWTINALCREKALSELPNGSMVKDGSSRPSTQGDRLANKWKPAPTFSIGGLEKVLDTTFEREKVTTLR